MMLNPQLVIESETKGIHSDIIFYEYTIYCCKAQSDRKNVNDPEVFYQSYLMDLIYITERSSPE